MNLKQVIRKDLIYKEGNRKDYKLFNFPKL